MSRSTPEKVSHHPHHSWAPEKQRESERQKAADQCVASPDGSPPAAPLQTFAASPFSDPFQLDNPDPQPIVDGEEGLIWVIGPVLAVVFIICIVIAILLYKK